MEEFATRLKRLMFIKGVRQIDLAKKTGINKGTLSHYMTGGEKGYVPKGEAVVKIANALGVTADYLLGNETIPDAQLTKSELSKVPSLLSVKTLLDKTTLPSIETVRKNRRSWEERIKEPFETALDKLYQVGVISDWKYSKAKDEDLTDDEAAQIDSFETFSSLFIHYEIKDPANLDEAIEKKRAQITARAASKKNRAKTEKKG